MILIGSKAILYWFPDFPRVPKDIDYAIDDDESKKGFELKSHPEKVEYLHNPVLFKYNKGDICTPDNLYTIKMSHLFWDINWQKHEWDATWLRERGCQLNYPLFWKLYKFHNELHGNNKRSDLKMSASKFFDNALKCEYSHDWLHTLLKPVPTFNKVLKDGAEVEVDEDKFQALTELEKEALVREEVYIMAFERWPNIHFRHAYGRMLKKFILSHAPVWEAIWILENYKRLCRAEYNFIEYLNEKIKNTDNGKREYITKRPARPAKKQVEV
jgi:hypothetical protein